MRGGSSGVFSSFDKGRKGKGEADQRMKSDVNAKEMCAVLAKGPFSVSIGA